MDNRQYELWIISNKTLGKSYIAVSTNRTTDAAIHWKLLRDGQHWLKELQADYRKGHTFKPASLVVTSDRKEAIELAVALINDQPNNCYNHTIDDCFLSGDRPSTN